MATKEKEIEKQRKEAERRAGVLLTKMAGGMIEQVDRLRRQGEAVSLLGRLASNMALIQAPVEELKADPSLVSSFYEVARFALKLHEGICEDFKRSLKMNDEDFEKQFPKPSSYFETSEQLVTTLIQFLNVELQMATYLFRFLM